ncbi:MAG: hypothetical protein P4L33_16130 [Capsulimonadaceae bacterium]|nr:hypothetical protein [Capsulimonadaceae bacterium]
MYFQRRSASAVQAAFLLSAFSCLLIGSLVCAIARADDDTGKDLQFISPLDGATIRETIPVRLPRADYPPTGYLTITIDGNFIQATALPDTGDVAYLWDTKGSYALPNNPDQRVFITDGDHTIMVKVFNRDNTILGTAVAKVRVANTIPELKDGVKLVYRWQSSPDLRYHRTSSIEMVNSNPGVAADPVQKSDVQFRRMVEDSEGGEFLIRDMVQDNGIVITKGAAAYVQTAYALKGRLRTVNATGATVKESRPINPGGSHFGFSVPSFPPRRIQVGDSWQSTIETSLQWACEHPTRLKGSAHLDSFEWQDGYPCAKIVETYSGLADYSIDAATNDVPPVTGTTVQLTRTVWFAYTSGRLIHVSTDATVNATMTSVQVAALGGDLSRQAAAPDTAGVNPFTPGAAPNPAGNMGVIPGASIDTGQAKAQVTFHITEEISPVK